MLTIVSIKLVCLKLAKVMVNWETTKKIIPTLYSVGEQIVVGSLHYIPIPRSTGQAEDNDSAQARSTEYLVYNWLEALAAYIQMAMLWHDTLVSLCAIAGLFSLFVLLTYFAPRFYATILIAMFVYNLIKVWFRHIWPEIRIQPDASKDQESRLDVDRWTYLHPHIMTLAELKQLFGNLITISELYLMKLLALRRRRPLLFCLAVCSTLSCTAYIGNSVRGVELMFWIVYALFLAPGIYLYVLPEFARTHLRDNFRDIIESAQAQSDESSPSPSSSLFELLKHLAHQSPIRGSSSTSPSTSATTFSMPIKPSSNTTTAATAATAQEVKSKRFETMTQVKEEDEEDLESHNNSKPRKNSEDMSSNESTSMIDFDEEQQDGFVIL